MSGQTISYRRPIEGLLATTGNTQSVPASIIAEPIYEALVVDVILDHTHKHYGVDGANVGTIKVRIFSVNHTLADENLPWADPIDSTIQEIPLIGEMVILHRILDNFYYTKKIPLARRLQENGMLKLNEALNKGGGSLKDAVKSSKEEFLDTHKFGNYFRPDNRVRQLKHFEGDVLFQGRMGQSIRFGSSKIDPTTDGLAPNLILRAGQGKNLENDEATKDNIFGLVVEDINKDVSSLWIVSDQTLPFTPATMTAGSFYRSMIFPPYVFKKAQVVANSDRVVLNAKRADILLFAKQEIYLNSFTRTSIDAEESIMLTANLDISIRCSRNTDIIADDDISMKAGSDISMIALEKISLVGKKQFFGSIQDDVEPMVGGTSLAMFLARLIWTLMGMPMVPKQVALPKPVGVPPAVAPGPRNFSHVLTPMGPGVLNPQITAGLIALYTELMVPPNLGQQIKVPGGGAPFNSKDNFVSIANQNTILAVEKNEFTYGVPISTENNEWKLSDKSYYKVV